MRICVVFYLFAQHQMYDQYVNFISLSPNLFSFNIKNCYLELHNPKQTDEKLNELTDRIVNQLFCVLVTLQKIPIIRALRNGPAEIIAMKLSIKLCNHLQSRNNLFSQSGVAAFQNRPLLLLFDRSFDFAQPLHHSPIYQSMLQDLLGLTNNQLMIANPENPSEKKLIMLDSFSNCSWYDS
ncbi:hypothetical protein RFI_17879 [Reticulomyxa filosa]|uniref:Uncharacterized protein n=1 Tax=Reticulomyxa filosa TaxID=46433 RepID=X6N0D6_RETFI|nr:hypothetical protein RFI_17879 [Reticulomyxa filosa]|eukprot:ETO19353.1 hypothetical protein RFI_17879 [Reticulomyxa filosa]